LEDGELLGFVVPVYFVGLPMIVAEFLQKLNVLNKQYTYAVLNCGGSIANTEGIFRRILQTDAIFGIVMVGNYVPRYDVADEKEVELRLNRAEQDIDAALKHIARKDAGTYIDFKGPLPRLITFIGYPLYKNGRKTNKFFVNESCNSCGLCQKICPRKVIKLEDKKPVWTMPQCELCLACLHRCPNAVINYGKKSAEHRRYVNPRVRL
jgi:NAD-dependent dihydropyrimidine dehydrogenase PreA subunit